MATPIDNLFISLGLDTKDVATGLQKAQSTIQSGLGSIVRNLAGPLTGMLALGGAVKQYLSNADAVGKLAASIGESGEEIQAWGEAATRSGGSADAFYSSLQSVSKATTDLVRLGGGAGREVFAQLGISAVDSSGRMKSATAIMRDLAGVAGQMDKVQFAGIASKLGIDAGTIKLLQQGGAAVDELVAKQKALGVYTEKDMEIAAKANDALADLLQAFKAIATTVLRVVVPALSWLSDKLTAAIVFLRSHQPFLIAMIVGIAAAITGFLIPAIYSMGKAWLRNPMTYIILAIVAVVAVLAAIIDDLVVYMRGGQSALSGFWGKFGTGEEIAKTLSEAWQAFKAGFMGTLEMLAPLIPTLLRIGAIVLGFMATVKVFNAIKTAITGVSLAFRALTMAFAMNPIGFIITAILAAAVLLYTYWDQIKSFFAGFFAYLGDRFSGLKDQIVAPFKAAADAIREIWTNIKDWIADKINGIMGVIPDFIKKKLGISLEGDIGEPTDATEGITAPRALSAADAVTSSVMNNRMSNVTSDTQINVGAVNVQTAATDANGIAGSIGGALGGALEKNLVFAANSGVIQK